MIRCAVHTKLRAKRAFLTQQCRLKALVNVLWQTATRCQIPGKMSIIFGIFSRRTDTKEQEVNCMARQKSLDILASGKKQWNTWRQTYPDVQAFEPDLHEAYLCEADLSGIDFHDADLTEANLQQADLRHANLHNTDFRHANLQNADLSDANLSRARLHGAELRGAKLCRANLAEADLSNADLRGADLLGADLTKAILKHTQFDEIKASAKT